MADRSAELRFQYLRSKLWRILDGTPRSLELAGQILDETRGMSAEDREWWLLRFEAQTRRISREVEAHRKEARERVEECRDELGFGFDVSLKEDSGLLRFWVRGSVEACDVWPQ